MCIRDRSLLATRMSTEQMLPIIDKMDKVGYHAVECWGGATFDSCLQMCIRDRPYEEELGSRSNFIASAPALSASSVSVPLNLGTPQDKLYSRFVLAVFDGTQFTKVSQPHYITNPELIARNQTPFNDPLTKKGLVIEIDMLSDAFDLGVKLSLIHI